MPAATAMPTKHALRHAEIPQAASQLLIATASSEDATEGVLACDERDGETWKRIREIPVVFGRTRFAARADRPDTMGTAHPPGRLKKEGDGATPIGFFAFLPAYLKHPLAGGIRWPHQVTPETLVWIDDPAHPRYNQPVDMAAHPKDWASAEEMRRADGIYDVVIPIDYNRDGTFPGAGSAIFFHIWRGPGHPTDGCTAMSREDIEWLLRWLDPAKRPILLQAPDGPALQDATA